MKLTITHNGFHGRNTLTFIAPDGTKPGDTVQVSKAVAYRLNKACCGVAFCLCGEGVAEEENNVRVNGRYTTVYEVTIPRSGEVRGNYPQN